MLADKHSLLRRLRLVALAQQRGRRVHPRPRCPALNALRCWASLGSVALSAGHIMTPEITTAATSKQLKYQNGTSMTVAHSFQHRHPPQPAPTPARQDGGRPVPAPQHPPLPWAMLSAMIGDDRLIRFPQYDAGRSPTVTGTSFTCWAWCLMTTWPIKRYIATSKQNQQPPSESSRETHVIRNVTATSISHVRPSHSWTQ